MHRPPRLTREQRRELTALGHCSVCGTQQRVCLLDGLDRCASCSHAKKKPQRKDTTDAES